MQRSGTLVVFVFFLFTSCFLYIIASTSFGQGLVGFFELGTVPLQQKIFRVYADNNKPTELQKLKEENLSLLSQLTRYKEQDKEIQALRDQFAMTTPDSQSLLPAQIIGFRSFIPGVSLPDQIIIAKGKKDGVKNGSAVVYKNNLIGKVALANGHISLIDLSSKKDFSLISTTLQTNSLGISRGQGHASILLDNVVLSDSLNKGDLVVTKGSVESDGSGIAPGFTVGKIVSIDKKASNLFQTARVTPLTDVAHLTTVFVVLR